MSLLLDIFGPSLSFSSPVLIPEKSLHVFLNRSCIIKFLYILMFKILWDFLSLISFKLDLHTVLQRTWKFCKTHRLTSDFQWAPLLVSLDLYWRLFGTQYSDGACMPHYLQYLLAGNWNATINVTIDIFFLQGIVHTKIKAQLLFTQGYFKPLCCHFACENFFHTEFLYHTMAAHCNHVCKSLKKIKLAIASSQ